jgi:release factor glutamine methyltransferase
MQSKQTIKTLLSASTSKLKSILMEDSNAFFEANLLLQYTLKVNRAWLISHENESLTLDQQATFEGLINQRLTGKPIAYLLGVREFYGLNLKITPDTLIPRPDTETLVEAALEKTDELLITKNSGANHPPAIDSDFHQNNVLKVLDLGTGSGAIALAIAKHRPHTKVIACDASKAALNIAEENAQNLNISNVQFILSNWFSALLNQRFHVIVSNPPYIENQDPHLSQGDLRFEPLSALASGKDGLDDIRQIIQTAPAHLMHHGWLMLEHGYNQATQVANLLKQAEFINIEHVLDLGGIQRVTLGQYAPV